MCCICVKSTMILLMLSVACGSLSVTSKSSFNKLLTMSWKLTFFLLDINIAEIESFWKEKWKYNGFC